MAGEATATSITPSGIEIAYWPPPDRHYTVNGQEVPSVSEVLDVLESKGLIWWGMQVGVAGVQDLMNRGIVVNPCGYSQDEIVDLLTQNKLTVNHVRDRAGDRGKAVHDAFEIWAATGTLPSPEIFPEGQQGYVRGVMDFLRDVEPEPVASEIMVASMVHGFAGRYDVRIEIPRKCEVVYSISPKRTRRAILKPGVILADLKTSKYVYDKHHLQIEAYEGASIESGYGPSDHRGILHVTAEGRYEFVRSLANFQSFLSVKHAYDAIQEMKAKKSDRTKAN